ncbi:hypothetical protein BDZ45DRAFT_754588 [Acephala macrosclerotiorum]|nr:hypothetical protein BDZ45DRAFT_754588 [Acephala macrosclerotiorum]
MKILQQLTSALCGCFRRTQMMDQSLVSKGNLIASIRCCRAGRQSIRMAKGSKNILHQPTIPNIKINTTNLSSLTHHALLHDCPFRPGLCHMRHAKALLQILAKSTSATSPMMVLAAPKAQSINLDLNYSQGFQYSVFQTTFRGYTYLNPAVTARESVLYYFSGLTTSTTFHRPLYENYVIDLAVAFTSLVWSPCGAHWPLNLGIQVALTSTNISQSGLMTDDKIDVSIKYITGIQWRRC